jgi:hypothetical protein
MTLSLLLVCIGTGTPINETNALISQRKSNLNSVCVANSFSLLKAP